MFEGDDCRGALGAAQIDEMLGRFAAVGRAKRSGHYEGLTPGYQLCVFMDDGSFVYANGYSPLKDEVEIIFNSRRYAVTDADFAEYLRNVCSGGDVPPAHWDGRPMLVMNGKKYLAPYKPESALPSGYASAGTLTAEQARDTGLEGTQFFTNPGRSDDFYTYQLCGTPTGLDEVDSQNMTWQYLRWIDADLDARKERRLTLDDVRRLAQKGEELSWDDFDIYNGTDISSELYASQYAVDYQGISLPSAVTGGGRHVMQYVIDDLFELIVGGDLKEKPDVCLRNRYTDIIADIRTGDVDAFINMSASAARADSQQVQITASAEVSASAPPAVLDYARDFVAQAVRDRNGDAPADGIAVADTNRIIQARITALELINTGTAALDRSINMYRLEYRLLPERQDNIVVAGGASIEIIDGQSWLTEWSSTGQPYLLLLCDENDSWTRIGVTSTLIMQEEYTTPEMLDKYGNMYTAAAMELYGRFTAAADVPDC